MAAKKKRESNKKTKHKVVTKKTLRKKSQASRPSGNGGFSLIVPEALEARLKGLAKSMDKSLDAILIQALAEFADTWEDHLRTVAALSSEDDRIQLVVKTDQ